MLLFLGIHFQMVFVAAVTIIFVLSNILQKLASTIQLDFFYNAPMVGKKFGSVFLAIQHFLLVLALSAVFTTK